MNKLGYSKIEILVVIVLLGIVAFITINHTSYAFAIDKNEAIEEVEYLIEVQAEDYALANTTLFEETNTTYISVDDLIEAGYLAGNESGVLTDPTDSSKNFNDKKVKLEYDEKKNNVTATVVD
ncbi:unknown [Mycoplasma sp. CAG:776]|jgi:type II secretory pathway pseudopilin PulG|nr:unknown [Mycoplasma sp. CAG:776]